MFEFSHVGLVVGDVLQGLGQSVVVGLQFWAKRVVNFDGLN